MIKLTIIESNVYTITQKKNVLLKMVKVKIVNAIKVTAGTTNHFLVIR